MLVIPIICSLKVTAQNAVPGLKIKTITEYNLNNKKKEIDHITTLNAEGLKTEEVEYFSDGIVKTRTVYEYDHQKRCNKATKYGIKGKVEKVTTYDYDNNGTKTKESILIPEKRYRTDKIFEHTYY